jgi:hypothetical protein
MTLFDGKPLVIRHGINAIEALRKIPPIYGVEIDIRYNPITGGLHLAHDPYDQSNGRAIVGDDFEAYMNVFAEQGNRFVIFNVKEMGIENMVLNTARKIGVKDFFLLDEEFPFIYRAAFGDMKDAVNKRIAIRYSEAEPIEQALLFGGKFDWVWVDTNTTFPLSREVYSQLLSAGFKIALVCPERWGRPQDVPRFIEQMKRDRIVIDMVMTSENCVNRWENSGVLKPFYRN